MFLPMSFENRNLKILSLLDVQSLTHEVGTSLLYNSFKNENGMNKKFHLNLECSYKR